MSQWVLYAFSGVLTLVVGVRTVFVHPRMMRKILALNLAGSGLFLLFVAIARREPEGPPDPVVHALVLTSIVVSVSATALALALLRRLGEDAPRGAEGGAMHRRDGSDANEGGRGEPS